MGCVGNDGKGQRMTRGGTLAARQVVEVSSAHHVEHLGVVDKVEEAAELRIDGGVHPFPYRALNFLRRRPAKTMAAR